MFYSMICLPISIWLFLLTGKYIILLVYKYIFMNVYLIFICAFHILKCLFFPTFVIALNLANCRIATKERVE